MTRRLLGLPAPEAWPQHVRDLLQPCHECESEVPCEFFRNVREGGGEDEDRLDGTSCATSGIGSDDSGHSAEKKPQKKKEKKKKPKSSVDEKPRQAAGDLPKGKEGRRKAKDPQSKKKCSPAPGTKAQPKAGAKRVMVDAKQKVGEGEGKRRKAKESQPKEGGSPGVVKSKAELSAGATHPEVDAEHEPREKARPESGRGGRGHGRAGGRGKRGGGSKGGRDRCGDAAAAIGSAAVGIHHGGPSSDGIVRLTGECQATVFGAAALTGRHSGRSVDMGGSVRILVDQQQRQQQQQQQQCK